MLLRYFVCLVLGLAPITLLGQVQVESIDLSQANIYLDSSKLKQLVVPGTLQDSPMPILAEKGNGNTPLITGLNQHDYKPVPIPNASKSLASKVKVKISPPTEWKPLPERVVPPAR